MTDLKDLNDVGLAILRLSSGLNLLADIAHDRSVTDETDGGNELLFLIDTLQENAGVLNERFSAIQLAEANRG